jgi:hypothetical protein
MEGSFSTIYDHHILTMIASNCRFVSYCSATVFPVDFKRYQSAFTNKTTNYMHSSEGLESSRLWIITVQESE